MTALIKAGASGGWASRRRSSRGTRRSPACRPSATRSRRTASSRTTRRSSASTTSRRSGSTRTSTSWRRTRACSRRSSACSTRRTGRSWRRRTCRCGLYAGGAAAYASTAADQALAGDDRRPGRSRSATPAGRPRPCSTYLQKLGTVGIETDYTAKRVPLRRHLEDQEVAPARACRMARHDRPPPGLGAVHARRRQPVGPEEGRPPLPPGRLRGAPGTNCTTGVKLGPGQAHRPAAQGRRAVGRLTTRTRRSSSRRPPASSTRGRRRRGWWLYRMLHTGHPLREKLTLFWHNHFATSQRQGPERRLHARPVRADAPARPGQLPPTAAGDVQGPGHDGLARHGAEQEGQARTRTTPAN